jgi:hypothetical protein
MHSPLGGATTGLLASTLLLGASSASGTTIDLLEDKRNVYIVGYDYSPPGLYRPWDFTLTDQTFTGEQKSNFYNDSFIGEGYASAGFEVPAADPEAFSTARFLFRVAVETLYKLQGTLAASSVAEAARSSVTLYMMDGIFPIPPVVFTTGVGFGEEQTSGFLSFEETVLLAPGTYELTIDAYAGYFGEDAYWDVRASVDPHSQDLPGAPPLAVSMALLAAWALWGRRAASVSRRKRE